MRPSNKGNGMTYDAELEPAGLRARHSLASRAFARTARARCCASHFEGKELNSPNDVVRRQRMARLFHRPNLWPHGAFRRAAPIQLGFQGVYRLPPGHRPGDEPQLVSDRYMFTQPNGLCLSPCERWMWVNDSDQANIRMFDVAEDGRLANGRIFASGIEEGCARGCRTV